VLEESADFFEAFEKKAADPPRQLAAAKADPLPAPPEPREATPPRPARRRPAIEPARAVLPPRQEVAAREPTPLEKAPPRRPARPRPAPAPAPAVEEPAGEASEPGATQTIEPLSPQSLRSEGAFTQVLEPARTEWEVTQELDRQGENDLRGTQEIPAKPREEFVSTQVISVAAEIDASRPTELFSETPTEATAPTQVIKEPEGLKSAAWPAPKGVAPRPPTPASKPAPRARGEKAGPGRKQAQTDKDLLAELEELIGRKIDEPTR
jgi:hypothetical protein